MSHNSRLTSVNATIGFLLALGAACGHAETPANPGGNGATGGSGPGTGGSGGAMGGTGGGMTGGTGGATGGAGGAAGAGATGGAMGGAAGATGGVGPAGSAGVPPMTGGAAGAGATGGSAGSGVMTSCVDVADQLFDKKTMPGDSFTPDPMVATIFGAMTQDQKILQMSGIPVGNKDYQDIERSPDVPVGGVTIRGYRYRDAGHGVNLDAGQDNRTKDANNFATAFPTQSSRGASWDLDLEWRLGEAIGDETAASKNNMMLAPCMNIIRHPYWGRTQETYGEDTYHMGRLASAFTAGLQQHVAACAKHYAGNNVEQNRANQDAVMDEQTLREIYGRHFEMVVRDGGVSCIMAAYNKVNGKKSTQSAHLLNDVLRTGFGFKGTTITDWWAMPGDQGPIDSSLATAQAAEAVLAGLDIEVPWTLNFGQLGPAIQANAAVGTAVDAAARRIVEQKFRFKSALSTDGWSAKGDANLRSSLSGASIATNQGHLDLAEEAEIKSAVLLTNGLTPGMPPVLPITGTPSIAVLGLELPIGINTSTTPPKSGTTFNMATHVAVGDRGSSRVNADPAQSVGPLKGLQDVGMTRGIMNVTSGNSATAAMNADFVVVVVGLTPGDEGEEYAIDAGGDRASLNLPGQQNQLVDAALALMKPTAIIIQSGSIVNLPWLAHANKNQATIWAGYGGMRAGLAYAKLLYGVNNFSGKMPLAWPKEADLIPFKDMPNSTTMGYFFGYRHYDRLAAMGMAKELVFPFGHGLSYSTFTYANVQVPCMTATEKAILDVTVDISNATAVPGEEVALLFIKGPATTATGARPVKELKSFTKVLVPAMGMVTAHLPLRINDLRHWEGGADGAWVIDKGVYTVLVGKSGADADLTAMGTFTIN
jgi:beta-glucosidase